MKGISSIIATLLMLIVTIGLAALAYGYIMGIWGSRIMQTFQVVEVYNDTVTIMNSGSNAITELKGTIYSSPVDAVLQVTPIDSSLVAYWHFDEGYGSITKDDSGNENNGNYYGNNPHTQSNSTVLYLTGGSPINLTHWFYLPDKAILSNVNLIVTYINNTANLGYKTIKVYVNGNYIGSFTDYGETYAKTYTFVNILKTNFTAGAWNSITYEGNVTNITQTTLQYQQDIGWVDGKFGKALKFDGVDDYVSLPSLFPNSGVCSLTEVAWSYDVGMDPSGRAGGVVAGWSNGWANIEYRDNAIRFELRNSSTGNGIWLSGNFKNKWIFTALVLDNGYVRAYLDGQKVWDGGYIGCIGLTSWVIGKWDRFFNGTIDEVRIYNRALSEDEIKAHASSNVGVAIMPGQTAKIKVLNVPSKGGHTLKLCTPNQCQTIYLTII